MERERERERERGGGRGGGVGWVDRILTFHEVSQGVVFLENG